MRALAGDSGGREGRTGRAGGSAGDVSLPLRTYNIVLTGVGGQGVVTAARLLAGAALASGLDLRMYGSYGMAQRGGAVSVHLRLGERVLNARVERGRANLIIGLELLETVRSLPLLAPGGVVVSSRSLIPPAGRPMREGAGGLLEVLESLPGSLVMDAEALAGAAGSRGATAVLLGAASRAPGFPIRPGALESAIAAEAGPAGAGTLEAFRRGRREAGREVFRALGRGGRGKREGEEGNVSEAPGAFREGVREGAGGAEKRLKKGGRRR